MIQVDIYSLWTQLLHLHALELRLLPPATKLGQGNIFRSVCQQFCPQGGHAWFYSGGCAWFYLGGVWFYSGGMHGFIPGVCGFIPGGHEWFHSGGHAWFYSGGHVWFFQFFRIQWDTVNERAVRILLECILVYKWSKFGISARNVKSQHLSYIVFIVVTQDIRNFILVARWGLPSRLYKFAHGFNSECIPHNIRCWANKITTICNYYTIFSH